MMEMIFEAVAGDGFWSPVTFIGEAVFRSLQAPQPTVGFHFCGVVLGLMVEFNRAKLEQLLKQ